MTGETLFRDPFAQGLAWAGLFWIAVTHLTKDPYRPSGTGYTLSETNGVWEFHAQSCCVGD